MSAAMVVQFPMIQGAAAEMESRSREGTTAVAERFPPRGVRGDGMPREHRAPVVRPQLAFYRKYTEGLLRRYQRLSMEKGRTPSLLGQEMFRGRVTRYKVRSFDDVVIFVMDVERCMERLTYEERRLIERIAVQEHTQGEAAALLGMSLRTAVRKYAAAVDVLTGIFLEMGLLEPVMEYQEMQSCREPREVSTAASLPVRDGRGCDIPSEE